MNTIDRTADRTADAAEIRRLTEDWARCANDRRLEPVLAQYADSIVAFDCIGPLRFTGLDSYRQHWQACMEMCQNGFFRIEDVQVEVEGDLAFCHFLAEGGGTDDKGETCSGWMRGTRCFRRLDGAWKVVHEHCSMPFDPETMSVPVERKS